MEYSIYERKNPTRSGQEGGFALGTVLEVDADNRRCSVRTSSIASSPELRDLYLPLCQWLNVDAGAEGDESTSIPRTNATCFVFFVCGQAFIWGFLSPTTSKNAPAGNIKQKANAGDKILQTIAENQIIMRSGGEIEIKATDSCQTIYSPDQHTISTQCRNYEFHLDGGYETWKSETGETLYKQEFRDSILRTQVIQEERGFVDSSTMFYKAMGLGIPGGMPGFDISPMWEFDIQRTGECTLAVHPPLIDIGFTANVMPTGAFAIDVGLVQFHFDVAPTGATNMNVNELFDMTIEPTGDFTIDIASGIASINVTPVGEITVENPTTTFSMSPAGEVKLDNPTATVSMTPAGEVTVENPTCTISLSPTGEIKVENPTCTMTMTATGAITLENTTATLEMDPTGSITLQNAVGAGIAITPAGQVAIGGPTAELLDLFNQLLTDYSTHIHGSGVGPTSPLMIPAAVIQIQTLLATIKGSL